MGKYTQIKEFERVRIYDLLKKGKGVTAIGQELGRDKSSISREIARNSDRIGYLYPKDAQKLAEDRKARHGSKINRNPILKAYILESVKEFGPQVLAGRWNLINPENRVSHEAIYQFAYHADNQDLALWKLFPHAKSKRGLVRARRSSCKIKHRVSIHKRPKDIDTRHEFGHFEADLFFNRGSQSMNVLTLTERKSRYVWFIKNDSKQSVPIIASIKQIADGTALSVTFDNGSEFAEHHTLGIPTYFCDPGAPWQKGGVENLNKLARTDVPFDMEPRIITQDYLDAVAHKLNNKPRKILGFLTPHEVFMQNVKTEERESRMKRPTPAAEANNFIYQKTLNVALHV